MVGGEEKSQEEQERRVASGYTFERVAIEKVGREESTVK